MSRSHLLKMVLGMSYEDLRQLYAKLGTKEKVADHLQVSRRTITNWMKEGGIKGHVHHTHRMKAQQSTQLFRWIKEHPGQHLPTTLQGIIKATGLPKAQISMALYRRKKALERYLLSQTPLQHCKGTFTDVGGRQLPCAAINIYSLRINRYSLQVHVKGELRSGEDFAVVLSKKAYLQLIAVPTEHPDGLEPLQGHNPR